MNWEILYIAAGTLAMIALGTLSNWIYDLLSDRGVFPRSPTIKWSAVIAIACLPFVAVVVISELPAESRSELLELAKVRRVDPVLRAEYEKDYKDALYYAKAAASPQDAVSVAGQFTNRGWTWPGLWDSWYVLG